MRTQVVMPGLNVEETVGEAVRGALEHVDGVIYVDDGSTDDSIQVAREAGADVVELDRNYGKGFALRTGFSRVSAETDVVVTMDSDGEHDPGQIPDLLAAINGADVVIGSRYAGRFYTFPRNVLGNLGLNFITNFFAYGPTGLLKHRWKGDTQSGFRAFRREALEAMEPEATRYAIEGEMVYEAVRNGLSIEEVPIRTRKRARGVTVRDGIRNALFLFKKRFL